MLRKAGTIIHVQPVTKWLDHQEQRGFATIMHFCKVYQSHGIINNYSNILNLSFILSKKNNDTNFCLTIGIDSTHRLKMTLAE